MFGASDEIYDLNQKLTELAEKCDQYRNERDAFKVELEKTKARLSKVIEGRKLLCDEIEARLAQALKERDEWEREFHIMKHRAEKAEACDAETHERAQTKLGEELKQAQDRVVILERGIRECEDDGGCRGTKYLSKTTDQQTSHTD
jgi:chromosome segregation ATPase